MSIVTVNVIQTSAPAPSKLQGTGAFVSQGGTTTTPGTSTLLTQLADLTAILKPPAANTSITWTTNVATVTTTAPHGFTSADTLQVTIAGATASAYNGTYTATVTGTSTFTYPLLVNPGGAASVAGTYVVANAAELLAMGTTFFSQGSGVSTYVLETGPGNAADGVTYLTTWLTNNPGQYYAFLVPRSWAAQSSYFTLLLAYTSTTSRLYFFSTATTGNYTSFLATMKDAFVVVEAPSIPTTEFSAAADFWDFIGNSPSSVNKVAPMAFRFLQDVTAYPAFGNKALLATLKAAATNYVGTGAEGGLSNTISFWGTTRDGMDASYWYSVDWVQINVDLNISNAVINGSNTPTNPLYYNQDGINRLLAVAVKTMNSGVSFGLVLGQVVATNLDQDTFNAAYDAGQFTGQCVINAVPFIPYSAANPNDYAVGKYGGFTIVYTPARGFTQIIFNVNVTDFVSP